MSGNTDQSPTQGSQAEANGSEGSEQQAPQTIPVERFNEVYKDAQENKRLMAEMQAALAQSQATIAQLSVQRQAPAEPLPELAPEDQKVLNAHLTHRLAEVVNPLKDEIRSLRAGMQQTQVDPQLEKVEARLAQINNPTITARTRELMDGLRKAGKLGSAYTPQEVLEKAIGEYSLHTLIQGNQNQQERQQYNGGGIVPLSAGGGGGARRAPVQQVAAVVSKSLTDMSPAELEAYTNEIEKKYPNGIPW